MEIFEYIAVLTSIIIGLGMAHLLRGVVRIIQHPERYPVYWIHLGWVVYMFISLVFWWLVPDLMDPWHVLYGGVAAAAIVTTLRPNLKRLLQGNERRISLW